MKLKPIILVTLIIISTLLFSSCGKHKTQTNPLPSTLPTPMASPSTPPATLPPTPVSQPTPKPIETPNSTPLSTSKADINELKSTFQTELDGINNIIDNVASIVTGDFKAAISEFSEIKLTMTETVNRMKSSYESLDDNNKKAVDSAENIVGIIGNMENEVQSIDNSNMEKLITSYQKMSVDFKEELSRWNNLSKA